MPQATTATERALRGHGLHLTVILNLKTTWKTSIAIFWCVVILFVLFIHFWESWLNRPNKQADLSFCVKRKIRSRRLTQKLIFINRMNVSEIRSAIVFCHDALVDGWYPIHPRSPPLLPNSIIRDYISFGNESDVDDKVILHWKIATQPSPFSCLF